MCFSFRNEWAQAHIQHLQNKLGQGGTYYCKERDLSFGYGMPTDEKEACLLRVAQLLSFVAYRSQQLCLDVARNSIIIVENLRLLMEMAEARLGQK